jgi:uncharacterized protein (TIGR02246 family)
MSSDLRQQTAATSGSASPLEASERGVLDVFDATSAAWADGDVDAFVTRYADHATVIFPGTYLRGKASIRAAMADAFAGPLKNTRRIHKVQSVRFLRDGAATVITRSATTLPGEADPAAQRWELATWVLSRQDGRWFVEAYHSCPATAS